MTVKLKSAILQTCKVTLQQRADEIRYQLREIAESMENETKSSVGDKHETARARMQSEQEKLQGQLADSQSMLAELEKISTAQPATKVSKGCLVKCNHGLFFIGPALGRIKVEGQDCYVISLASPLGKLMAGKKVADTFALNGKHYAILEMH